jgi:hypothetical protein
MFDISFLIQGPVQLSEDSIIARIVKTIFGGNGTSASSVAQSCKTAKDFYNVTSDKIFINPDLNASRAVQVQCIHGTSLGGDGSSVEASSVSCVALWTHWGLTNGMYFVNGMRKFAFLSMLSKIIEDYIQQAMSRIVLPKHRQFKLIRQLRCLHASYQ